MEKPENHTGYKNVKFLPCRYRHQKKSWMDGILFKELKSLRAEGDHFKDLQDEIDALRIVQPDLIPEDINAASLVDVDVKVSAVQPPPTDAEI